MAPPVVAFSPGAGAILPSTPIYVDVTSAPALQVEVLYATLPGVPTTEVVWDGTGFTSQYVGSSSRSPIAGGFRYLVRRGAAWPDSPTISVLAINTSAEQTSASAAYTLPGATMPPSTPGIPVFSSGSNAATYSTAVAHTQDGMLRVMERAVDEGYIAPIRASTDGGYEVFQAYAQVLARSSQAVTLYQLGTLVQFAPVAGYAAGTVEFYRDAGGAGSVTINKGTIVSTLDGRRFIVLQDVAFAGSSLGPVTAQVRALVASEQWNVPGVRVLPSGDTVPGAIARIDALLQTPIHADPTIRVRQISDMTGGSSDWLGVLGYELGMPRGQQETDAQYRNRLRTLPDTVSPAAMQRAARAAMRPWGGGYAYLDTREASYQMCYDAPRTSRVFTYDDPRSAAPFRNRYLDEVDHLKGFILVLDPLQAIKDRSGCYDDTALDAAAATSSVSRGRRAMLAYDLEATIPALAEGRILDGCYDGRDYTRDGVYAGIWKDINAKRAAGIPAAIEMKGQ